MGRDRLGAGSSDLRLITAGVGNQSTWTGHGKRFAGRRCILILAARGHADRRLCTGIGAARRGDCAGVTRAAGRHLIVRSACSRIDRVAGVLLIVSPLSGGRRGVAGIGGRLDPRRWGRT